jgi:hypothetical protein
MKYNINTSEKKRILDMHSKQKKFLVREQSEKSLYDKLQSFIESNYIHQPAKVVKMKSSKPDLSYAIKKESTKTPGTFKYFFIDGRVGGMVDGKFVFDKRRWPVDGYDRFLKNKEIESANTANTAEINKLKKGGWDTESELLQSGIPKDDLLNPNLYLKNTSYGVTLYKSKVDEDRPGEYSARQKSFLDDYRKDYYHPKNEFPNEIHSTLNCKPVLNSEGLFPKGFLVCQDPNNLKGLPKFYAGDKKENQNTQTNQNNVNNTDSFATQQTSQTKTKEQCKAAINGFYNAWYNGDEITDSSFGNRKNLVQKCVNQYKDDFGCSKILGKIFDKSDCNTKKQILVLTGRKSTEGKGPAPSSPYRLKPPIK